ncbi:DUF4395 domain-containing protein [Nocardioides cynanchi]|uniref:DUF4395 domain-containing protein n=1 Tax=Nocardioides cynanchi TaxID=2558918 RepID=UPI001244ECEF|nr:DUF4395 domain-containing protein [Nocardioides cynanchi]
MSVTSNTAAARVGAVRESGIDPRGPRLSAALTSVVLVGVLVAPSAVAVWLLAAQAAVFAVGTARGIQHTPYAWLFRTLVRPMLAAPAHFEDPAPPRFAQAVGLGFALVGLLGFAVGVLPVALVATGFALAAALLNAVFGFCLGCEIYLLLHRATAR